MVVPELKSSFQTAQLLKLYIAAKANYRLNRLILMALTNLFYRTLIIYLYVTHAATRYRPPFETTVQAST